jgi:hypothetical protein
VFEANLRISWPTELHALVRKYGPNAVKEAGENALGYPGMFATEEYERRAIRKKLEEMFPPQPQQQEISKNGT